MLPEPLAGVDEVGRGPLAGPVVAAAVILDRTNIPNGINDSKAVPEKRREALALRIRESAMVGVGLASPQEIDRLNIHRATLLAMARAVEALPVPPAFALVDGRFAPELGCPARAVVRGDSRSLSIAAASVVAKVARDRIMAAAAVEDSRFGWDRNKGYPTPAHLTALARFGPSPLHRRSFGPVRAMLSGAPLSSPF